MTFTNQSGYSFPIFVGFPNESRLSHRVYVQRFLFSRNDPFGRQGPVPVRVFLRTRVVTSSVLRAVGVRVMRQRPTFHMLSSRDVHKTLCSDVGAWTLHRPFYGNYFPNA